MVGYDKEDDQLKAVSFAAGTSAFIACIERAITVFVHWRVWAFLALNLLLLAILFTSKSPNPYSDEINRQEYGATNYSKFKREKKKKKRRQECSRLLVSTSEGNPVENETKITVEHVTENREDGDVKQEDYDQLSEEELNQRVEAFIAMFRQQYLVSDAKVNKSCGLHCIAKNVSMTSNQVNSPQHLSLT